MRTTIRLDHLFARLKKRASESAVFVSQLIEQAVELLRQPPPPRRRKSTFKLVTFGVGGRFARLNIDKTSSVLEADDLDRVAQRP